MDQQVHLVRAFGTDSKSGNPAGVVLDAKGISKSDRQAIATRVGYSETAFLEEGTATDFKIQFFTPNREIDACGHATVASFFLLRSKGGIKGQSVSVSNNVGVYNVHFRSDGKVFMEQQAPVYEEVPSELQSEVAKSLGLRALSFSQLKLPKIVSTGNRFFLACLEESDLAALKPEQTLVASISEKLKLIGYYVFAMGQNEFAATSRMFAPAYGISEESGTGMAAGPLACLLHDYFQVKEEKLVLQQGKFMSPPTPSQIDVELNVKSDRILSLLVGGRAFIES